MKKNVRKIFLGGIVVSLMVVNFVFGKEKVNVNTNLKNVVSIATAYSESGKLCNIGGVRFCVCPDNARTCYCVID